MSERLSRAEERFNAYSCKVDLKSYECGFNPLFLFSRELTKSNPRNQRIMARTRKSKEDILDRLENRIAKSTSVVFANVKGLKVKQIETLRSNLRKEDMECVVVKKTLLSRAFSDAGISSFDFKGLEGEVATVFSFADQVAPARVLTAMAKQYEPLGILAGLLRDASTGDQVLTSVQIRALALLPSRDELRARVVGTLAAPMQGFVGVLNGSLRSLVQVLNAYAESK